MVSIFLKLLLMTFFCIQTLKVVDYSDNSLNVYAVLDQRNDMPEPVELIDYNMRIYFGMGDLNAAPVLMDPRIGRIDLWQTKGFYDGASGIVSQSTPIPYREIDFLTE